MGLFEDICSLKNLFLGFDRVEENGGGPGIDHVTVQEFSVDLDKRIISLGKELIDSSYNPAPLMKISIPKDNGKLRWLSIPTVRDRVAQTSAAIVLTPVLDPEFEDCSYAYRKDMSVMKAVRKVISLREQGYVWVVDADIKSYFDEVDHQLLLNVIGTYVGDEKVGALLNRWLDIGVICEGKRSRLTKGIPQGSPISPLLANLYLDSFDEALMKGKFKHVRFSDDFVILCKDKPAAEDALELTEELLGGLRLTLNMEKTRIVHFNQGFRYLGMEFLRSMVFKPSYDDEDKSDSCSSGIDHVGERTIGENVDSEVGKTDSDTQCGNTVTFRDNSGNRFDDRIGSRAPDTQMAEAFKEALKEARANPNEAVVEKHSALEPSISSDPLARTLYLLEQGSVLKKEDEHFIIAKDGKSLKEIPAIKVDQIFVFGNIQITTQAMKFCLERSVPLLLLSCGGSYFGSIEAFGNVAPELHRSQFMIADDTETALGFCRSVIHAKIHNGRVLLQRYKRGRPVLDIGDELGESRD